MPMYSVRRKTRLSRPVNWLRKLVPNAADRLWKNRKITALNTVKFSAVFPESRLFPFRYSLMRRKTI